MGEEAAMRSGDARRVTEAQRTTFLDVLAATGNVRAAARAAAASVTTFYNRRRVDRAFAVAWDGALAVAYAQLEAAAMAAATTRDVPERNG